MPNLSVPRAAACESDAVRANCLSAYPVIGIFEAGISPEPEAHSANKIPEADMPPKIQWLDAPPVWLHFQHEQQCCCYKTARPQHLHRRCGLSIYIIPMAPHANTGTICALDSSKVV